MRQNVKYYETEGIYYLWFYISFVIIPPHIFKFDILLTFKQSKHCIWFRSLSKYVKDSGVNLLGCCMTIWNNLCTTRKQRYSDGHSDGK